jgi:hypothetical protein
MPKYTTFMDARIHEITVDHDFEDARELLTTDEGRKLVVAALRRRIAELESSTFLCCSVFELRTTVEQDQL